MTPPAQPAGGDKPRPYSRQAHPDLASLVSVVALTGVLAGTVAWQVWAGWGEVNVAGNTQARNWAVSTLQAAPPDAVLRSMDDATTFPLWYAQHALGLRPDVAIEDGRLAAGFDWYRRQLTAQYPQLRAPGAVQAVASGHAPDGVAFVDVPVPPEAEQQ